MEVDNERTNTRSPSDYNNDEALHEIEQLANIVTSINVEDFAATEKYMAQNFLQKLIYYLSKDYNTSFLSDYLRLLEVNNGKHNHKPLNIATAKIMTSIETEMIKKGTVGTHGEAGVVVAAWLGAAVLWDAPRVPPARDALHALLPLLVHAQTVYLATMWWTLLSPGALLQLIDAIPSTALARLLLRAALSRLQSPITEAPIIPNWEAAPVTPEEIAEVFEATKRAHTTHPQPQSVERRVSCGQALLLLVRLWARVRACSERGTALDVRGLSDVCFRLHVYQVQLAILSLENIFDNLEKPEQESESEISVDAGRDNQIHEGRAEPVASTSTATLRLEAYFEEETLFSV